MNSDNCSRSEILILGGGVAGLSASLLTGAPVYEADSKPGGACASDEIEGFVFDRGIHVLQTTNEKILRELNELGVEFNVKTRSAFIHAMGKDTPYPFQVNSTNLPILLRLKCVLEFFIRWRNPEPKNYADWIYRSVGRGFGDTYLIPYSEKFWKVHPREMTFDWTDNRIPKVDVIQVLRGAFFAKQTPVGSNAVFRYPRGRNGYGAVSNALSTAVGSRLHCGQRATAIDTKCRRVIFNNESSIDYGVLINTIPLPDFVRLVSEVPNDVRAAAAELRTNSIMVVNLGVDRPNISTKHWIHYPEPDISFFRLSFPSNLSVDTVPSRMSAISCEVSYSLETPPDKDALAERVIKDLIRVGVLHADDRIVLRHVRDIPYGYCIFNDARGASLSTIKSWLKSVNVVPGGRYGLWEYFWSDEAIVSGERAAAEALSLLGQSTPALT
jgi:UDP-galactopyranose mutase